MTTPDHPPTITVKPEHFRVVADQLGDMSLECGGWNCGWDRAIRHWDPTVIQGDDLGSLLAAAHEHLTEAHRVTIDGEATP